MISQNNFIAKVQNRKNRLQKIYVYILRFLCNCFALDFKLAAINKTRLKYTYITICNLSSLDMVKASLYSFFKNSEKLPERIVIVSDGSWSSKQGCDYFKKYNLDVECIQWDECSDYFRESCISLTDWANKQIWGKKMASILYFSEKGPVLFADPDILWYSTPIDESDIENTDFKISMDNSHNYDFKCLDALKINYLTDYAPINCGVVFMNFGIDKLTEIERDIILYESNYPGSFAEQTLFAQIASRKLNLWEMTEISSEIKDVVYPIYKKTIKYPDMIARHYLWRLKWIYWKDYLRILMKPNLHSEIQPNN